MRRRTTRVVYHERYNAAFPSLPNDPLRADRILAFLASEGLVLRRSVCAPRPASPKQLARAHRAAYLDTALHDGETLARVMGAAVTPDQVDRLLDHQRLNVGGTVLATRLALRRRAVAINLGGGLHHARPDEGAGFCVFNDVAVAIRHARAYGFDGRVLVIDLDLHDGDGTRAAFADDPSVHTLSIHARHWGDPAARESTSIELGDRVEDQRYLEAVQQAVPEVMRRFDPALVFYLAGTDPAHDDPLGDWRISARAMLERDRLVFGLSRRGRRALPLVIVLAGGYGPETWRYSARFLSAVLGRKPIEPPTTEAITIKRYRYIAGLLDPAELHGGAGDDDFGLTEEDLIPPSWGLVKETRLLGHFTKHGIELLAERAGLFDRLRDLGYRNPTVTLGLDDPAGHTLRVYGDQTLGELLVELRLTTDRRSVEGLDLLSIAWLMLQNPRAAFHPGRSQLPGQRHPGLGMAHDVLAILIVVCERLHLDGIAFVPSHYHVAAPWKDQLIVLDAGHAALFHALLTLFAGLPLDQASRALAAGRVIDQDSGEPVRWPSPPVVLPLSAAARRWAERRDAGDVTPPRLMLQPESES